MRTDPLPARLHPGRLARLLYFVALTAATANTLPAQRAPSAPLDSTSIVVLGTVHAPTPRYDQRILAAILERVRPDVILVELDSSFFDESMHIKPAFEHISMENAAVADYARRHQVTVRPYDIEGRNRIYQEHDYFAQQRKFSSALNAADKTHALDATSQALLGAVDRFDAISAAIGAERPEVINSAASDVAMAHKHYYGDEGLLQIARNTAALRAFETFCTFNRDFWTQRNEAMAAHIQHWTELLHPKVELVLGGYEHRYFLRQRLTAYATSHAVRLRDYWEF